MKFWKINFILIIPLDKQTHTSKHMLRFSLVCVLGPVELFSIG
jgi:hypothetical protein